jgi:hypothetical protein
MVGQLSRSETKVGVGGGRDLSYEFYGTSFEPAIAQGEDRACGPVVAGPVRQDRQVTGTTLCADKLCADKRVYLRGARGARGAWSPGRFRDTSQGGTMV